MFDTLIKGGTVIDGTGAERRQADIGVARGKIVALEPGLDGEAAEVIDASGMIVTPGFVDMHTHYDGQATWDDQLLPSTAHGVTTAIMGNCGIGFAPVRPGGEDWLVAMMEGTEDIPGAVLSEGIPWGWETFPQYLDFLEARRFACDIATQAPHSALRVYVMGERTVSDGPATAEDLRQMAKLAQEAVEAGALGVATSRITMHYSSDGNPLPGTSATENEVMALADAARRAGGGVVQLAPSGLAGEGASVGSMGVEGNGRSLKDEVLMIRRVAAATGQPMTFALAEMKGLGAAGFGEVLELIAQGVSRGEPISPQFAAKPTGALSTLGGFHAFQDRPTYRALEHLPVEERARRMRDPAVKAAILAEDDLPPASAKHMLMNHFPAVIRGGLSEVYPLDDQLDYEPLPSTSMLGRAQAAGREPLEYLYDYMLEENGRSLLTAFASNYIAGDLSTTERMLRDPHVLLGLADGGAHVRAIVDASQPTFVLTHWGRDRTRGPTLPLELLIKKQTHDTASFYGLRDRGVLAPKLRADLNIIDMNRLRLGRPHLVSDLPAGGLRFLQEAVGYKLTMVNGVATRRDDQDTGARPGRLVRGRQAAP